MTLRLASVRSQNLRPHRLPVQRTPLGEPLGIPNRMSAGDRPRGYPPYRRLGRIRRRVRDTWLQTLELLRDTTHVRSYRPSECIEMFGSAGFSLRTLDIQRMRLNFSQWVERSGTPPTLVTAIRHLFESAPDEVRDSLSIGEENDFTIDIVVIEAVS